MAVGAIYWHVRSKRESLSTLADRIVTEARESYSSADTGGGWEANLANGARAHGIEQR